MFFQATIIKTRKRRKKKEDGIACTVLKGFFFTKLSIHKNISRLAPLGRLYKSFSNLSDTHYLCLFYKHYYMTFIFLMRKWVRYMHIGCNYVLSKNVIPDLSFQILHVYASAVFNYGKKQWNGLGKDSIRIPYNSWRHLFNKLKFCKDITGQN